MPDAVDARLAPQGGPCCEPLAFAVQNGDPAADGQQRADPRRRARQLVPQRSPQAGLIGSVTYSNDATTEAGAALYARSFRYIPVAQTRPCPI